ncbi:magnesium transporter [Spirochaetota bacterium]
MKNPILVPELRELLRNKKHKVLKSFMHEGHPKDIAEFLGLLSSGEIWKLLTIIDVYIRDEIFSYLDMDVQIELLSTGLRKNVSEILASMSHDNRADLFQNLDKNVADSFLLYLPVSERTDILKLTSYNEETAGAIMTTDYSTLNENDNVEKAIRKIRQDAPSKETVYYIYVTDNDGKLIGFVSLRKLILARPRQKVANIMKKDVVYANVNDDQENAARVLEEYGLIALPIVDNSEKLLGIITYDDAIEVIREEETEDLEKLMAISGGVEEKPYLEVPAFIHFRKRAFWVIILGLFGLLTGLIIEVYQKTLETLIVLTFYMPLLNAAGGNTGSQSATVVLRSLTLKELSPADIFKVIKKETLVSFLLSICLGLVTFGRVYLFPSSGSEPSQFSITLIALVISISLGLQVLWSTVFGAIIPIIATKLKMDPAVVSSPLLTTFVDMGGIVIYFTTAKFILGI